MRSFEERKAEVMLRSKTRIKKRRAVIGSTVCACIPLIICLTVFSLTISNLCIKDYNSDGVIPESNEIYYADTGFVEVTTVDGSHVITVPESVETVTDVIDSIVVADTEEEKLVKSESTNDNIALETVITVTDESGIQRQYMLKGHTLIFENQQFKLTDLQFKALQEAIKE